MSLDTAIQAVVRAALEAELPAVLNELTRRSRMVPIKSAPIAYRAILKAENEGKLAVYRIGNSSFVDETELFAFVRAEGVERRAQPVSATDEIGALLEINQERRSKRGGRAA